MCHHTVRKSWGLYKPGSRAAGPMPSRAFEALATQSSWGWPAGGSVAFISVLLCPFYLRLSRRPGGPTRSIASPRLSGHFNVPKVVYCYSFEGGGGAGAPRATLTLTGGDA